MRKLPVLIVMVGLSGCGLFDPRTPEPPVTDSGTYVQPDTPDRVIDNLEFSISELNTLNYRRSFAGDFTFVPTATAQAREPIWTGWDRTQEESYFAAMVAAAQNTTGNSLQFNDYTLSATSETTSVLDATYVLTIQHKRPNVPTVVQGRLHMVLAQGIDGLWSIRQWTDQELGDAPSWSDLKAAFYQ